MLKEIRNKIIEVLDTVESVKVVYGSPVSSVDGWPAVIVFPNEMSSEYLTLRQDKAAVTYDLQIIHPVAEHDPVDVDEVVLGVADDLLDVLLPLNALDPVCNWVEPLGVTFGFQDRPEGRCRVGTLKIRCSTHLNR